MDDRSADAAAIASDEFVARLRRNPHFKDYTDEQIADTLLQGARQEPDAAEARVWYQHAIMVAQRTGLSQQEAEKRVSDGYAQLQSQLEDAKKAAQTAVDEARKASARVTLWLFIALLIGAFVASFSAIYGGRHRDL